MEQATTLKPCPFCGASHEVALEAYGGGTAFTVTCFGCGTKSGNFSDADSAVNTWNHRPTEQALTEQAIADAAAFMELAKRNQALLEALKKVLATGLNGGNNLRLAYIAAGRAVLSQDLLDKAEASEQAVTEARALIAAAS